MAIRWCRPTFHDSAFALLDTMPAVTDRRTRCCLKDRAMHSVARVKMANKCTIVARPGHSDLHEYPRDAGAITSEKAVGGPYT